MWSITHEWVWPVDGCGGNKGLESVQCNSAHSKPLKMFGHTCTFNSCWIMVEQRENPLDRCLNWPDNVLWLTEHWCTVNLVKLATDKTLDFYYIFVTSDLSQRICGYQCSSESSPCCKFY